jgi:hypothetical protein
VLIARPRGLEDSSRYWSVWMTLDHLRIVHLAAVKNSSITSQDMRFISKEMSVLDLPMKWS